MRLARTGTGRRRPEETLLHELVREHWPRFVERAEEQGGGLPQFVVHELEGYLRCGIHHDLPWRRGSTYGEGRISRRRLAASTHADLKYG